MQIVTGVPVPPDFTTFWKQCAQQGFKPKIASVGKALLFPSSVNALGPLGARVSTEVWWSPSHPFTSSLTGQSAAQLAGAFTTQTKKEWTQPLGDDKQAIVDAIKTTNMKSIGGPINFSNGPGHEPVAGLAPGVSGPVDMEAGSP